MRLLTVLILVFAVAGCGTIYRSSRVVEQSSSGSNIRVLPINGETVVLANRSSYQPKTLPAIFSHTAGDGSGQSPRGLGALPEAPSTQDAVPGRLELRPPSPANPGPYTIGVGDVVVLATPGGKSTVAELTGLLAAQNARQGYTVQDDGAVNIPDVGRVRIGGMTVDDAEAVLFQKLVENQIDPTFSLEVSEFKSKKVSVGGAVGKPGVINLTLRPLYLDEALAQSGSVSVSDIDFSSVRIYRDGKLYQIPLGSLYASAELQQTRLIDGDSVFVDTEYQLDRAAEYFSQQITLTQLRVQGRNQALGELSTEIQLRRANLSEARSNYQARRELSEEGQDYVYLTGEVGTQSRYALPIGRRATLADAIYNQGGGIAKSTGDVSQIYVLRASEDPLELNAVTAWHLDTRNAANLTMAAQFQLRPNDVVFVAENPVTRWGRTIAQITPSLITATAANVLR